MVKTTAKASSPREKSLQKSCCFANMMQGNPVPDSCHVTTGDQWETGMKTGFAYNGMSGARPVRCTSVPRCVLASSLFNSLTEGRIVNRRQPRQQRPWGIGGKISLFPPFPSVQVRFGCSTFSIQLFATTIRVSEQHNFGASILWRAWEANLVSFVVKYFTSLRFGVRFGFRR
jgi:hypothetical protein